MDKNKIDVCDNTGCNALIAASKNGCTEIVKQLLPFYKGDNQYDGYGCNALLWASRVGHKEIVDLLLTHFKENVVLNNMILPIEEN